MNTSNKSYRPLSACLKGKFHSSRGQRPRGELKGKFCPVRAIQNPPFFKCHAAIITHSERTYHFFHQTAAALVDERNTATSLGLSSSNSSDLGMQFDNDRRRGRPCAYPLQSFEKARVNESTGSVEERFFEIYKNIIVGSFKLPLAGWLRSFRYQPFPLSLGQRIHFGSRRTSQETNVPRGTSGYSQKIQSGIRRTLSLGLKKSWISFSGRDDFLLPVPRALPSAGMVQAFGPTYRYCHICPNKGGTRSAVSTLSESAPSFQTCQL
jgi:hypothetical protein